MALVTGGNRGIGRAIVEHLVEHSWQVAFTWRSGAAEAEALAGALGSSVRAYSFDLGERAAAKELVRRVEEEVGPIDGLVNNAGFQETRLLAMTGDDLWHRTLDINLGGAFRLCRALVPQLVRRRRGSIVNLSSLSALQGVAGEAPYAAAKAGLLAMTRTLAREVGRRGIRVNAVVPGFVETEMTSRLDPALIEQLRARECLPDGTSPAAVAHLVGFLLSDASSAITGQTLHVDAGASC